MIELKPIQQIMRQYLRMLKKYEYCLDKFNINDIKHLIGEVKIFWYRNSKLIDYFISNITEDDEVSFLAGAVYLDIINNGEYDFVISGKVRLINDPLIKMEPFYQIGDNGVDIDYVNGYITDCIRDLIAMLEKYPNDFCVVPLEYISDTDNREYYETLAKAADKMFYSMFVDKIDSEKAFLENCETYEKIEEVLLPSIKDIIVLNGFQDQGRSLRDKCSDYITSNKAIMSFMDTSNEAQILHVLLHQFIMQAIAIAMITIHFHMIPFIRNDVSFRYYELLYHTRVFTEITRNIFMKTYIPYVLQKTLDLSTYDYNYVKEKYGDGILTDKIISTFADNSNIPNPDEITNCAMAYISHDIV